MAASSRQKSIAIGVIAEDKSDVLVLAALTGKIIDSSAFSVSQFVGRGCGKLRQKCAAWTQDLFRRGCNIVVVLHDCDDNQPDDLCAMIKGKLGELYCEETLILIPVVEIEAWLLSDPKAIQDVFNMRKRPKITRNVESICNPKEFLAEIVNAGSKTRFLHTVHNAKIASHLDRTELDRLPSWQPYPEFIASAFS